jgi:hypothetical protein
LEAIGRCFLTFSMPHQSLPKAAFRILKWFFVSREYERLELFGRQIKRKLKNFKDEKKVGT